MTATWTFGRKIGTGFAIVVGLSAAIGIVSMMALRSVVTAKDQVITVDGKLLVDARELQVANERKGSAGRGFLLTREDRFLDAMRTARAAFTSALDEMRRDAYTEETRRLLGTVERAEAEHQSAFEKVIGMRRGDAKVEDVARAFDSEVVPPRERLDAALGAFIGSSEKLLEDATQRATDSAAASSTLVLVLDLALAAIAVVAALWLTRSLSRQIGTAVGQVQSSSTELQAAANQQATGAREQATAMNEITTTINELLATSRQIAESAQRVAQIAEEAVQSARTGEGTVERAHESVAAIRRQTDLVVEHMLELGRKSQQIGAVLDIVSELAEQTNILAINATIEAAGAGEAGKRFAVVADEIRKLADRVASSMKEIRGLIDDVRGAVNTTVMVTETGSKAVDAGARQFGEVSASFKSIAALIATTTEAAREIELSTKQQSTAVEQVNVAISSVAQATRETEASSGQTLQTASQLAGLSGNLLRIVRPQAA